MNLEGVAEYLENEGVGTRGVDIHVNNQPAARPSAGLLLRPPFGGTEIDHELPGYRKTSFMLIARAESYEDAKALIDEATTVLNVKNKTLPGMHVNYMRPRTDPVTYPPTEGGNMEFLVNMDACYVLV